jgi:hypothetical protein
VWLGLIVTAWLAGILPAQEPVEPEPAAARRPADPLVLAADQVARWNGAAGSYIALSGDASVLQGADGLRARQAVARIVAIPDADGPLYQVEVYAEGEVRDSLQFGPPRPRHRASFRASQVQLRPYRARGLTALAAAPADWEVLRRSGFLEPLRPGATARPAGPAALIAGPGPATEPPATTAGAAPPGPATATSPRPRPKRDSMVIPAQMVRPSDPGPQPAGSGLPPPPPPSPDDPPLPGATVPNLGTGGQPPPVDLPPIEGAPAPGATGEAAPGVEVPQLAPNRAAPGAEVPQLAPNREDLPPGIEPLPAPAEPGEGGAVPGEPEPPAGTPAAPLLPFIPGTQRVTTVAPRSGRELSSTRTVRPDGVEVYVFRGGINLVTRSPRLGIIDIEADEAVIWRGPEREKGQAVRGPNGEWIDDDKRQPMEVYLEGHVILRQDQNKWAGKGDQRTMRAPRVYYDFLADRFLAHDAQLDIYNAGLLAPFKIKSPRIEQFHPLIKQPDGSFKASEHPQIRTAKAVTTGSRFPNPGYRITNQSVDLTRHTEPAKDPISGRQLGKPGDPDAPQEIDWTIDARQNFYFAGPIPVFYWPHVVTDVNDLEPPLRQIFFRTNNYFGQQLLTDWNGFRFIGRKRPDWIDLWNVDVDYLSARTKGFPALGTELGWFGRDFFRDLSDPYHQQRGVETVTKEYFGFFDIWGLRDFGTDVLGTGPAIITNGPPGAGKAGIQRGSVPPFQDFRGRFNIHHNQYFISPDPEEHPFDEFRLQLEAAAFTDRYFLEEYYKRLHDAGQDQETLAYLIYQENNQVADLWAEVNLMNWQTETQWLPRADYYRLGDSFFSDWFTHYQHSGADYATIHTDIMVNNPNLFAYMPIDPISNTSGVFSSGRFFTTHEVDMPLKFYNAVRLVPYVQGQVAGWTDQLGAGPLGHQPSGPLGRVWGAAGARAEVTAWKMYRGVESDLLNVHGLNNKLSFFADARAAWSNVRLNSLAIQDDLDDNTYEAVRRYFAITSFMGGLLPFPYDPRHLILRRMTSPITGSTDVQATIDTVYLGVHQRLQTKRGPVGRRRIVDYMTFDANTTYFPNATRDNFGANWGQTMYNYQWYIGDRTSIVSTGWFEFWKLVGSNPLSNNMVPGYNPTGLNVITSGVSLSRPPRTNLYIGYSIIDTGPIRTSALNTSISYWLSPKWYGTFATSYDFGNAVLLGSMFTFTRIGADYLTTIGLSVDPQRMSYQFAFQLTPRGTPAFRMGSNAATNTFDTRFAPTQ